MNGEQTIFHNSIHNRDNNGSNHSIGGDTVKTYDEYLEEYVQTAYGYVNKKYLRKFINFAQSSNTPVGELEALRRKYQHQLNRGYSESTSKWNTVMLKKFVKYMEHEDTPRTKKRRGRKKKEHKTRIYDNWNEFMKE